MAHFCNHDDKYSGLDLRFLILTVVKMSAVMFGCPVVLEVVIDLKYGGSMFPKTFVSVYKTLWHQNLEMRLSPWSDLSYSRLGCDEVKPCKLLHRHFAAAYCVHIHGRKMDIVRSSYGVKTQETAIRILILYN
jgi:hypothetical protein